MSAIQATYSPAAVTLVTMPLSPSAVSASPAGQFAAGLGRPAAAQATQMAPSASDPFLQFGKIGEEVRELQKGYQQLSDDLASGKIDMKSDAYMSRVYDLMGQTLSIQSRAQATSFGAELLSKLVEHATSGTRTVLQTQM